MTTSDPDVWVGARVEALEVANGVAAEKIAALDGAVGDLYRRCQELDDLARRLEAALNAQQR
jgi:hypothetical protein